VEGAPFCAAVRRSVPEWKAFQSVSPYMFAPRNIAGTQVVSDDPQRLSDISREELQGIVEAW
jgi:hypothetical protein